MVLAPGHYQAWWGCYTSCCWHYHLGCLIWRRWKCRPLKTFPVVVLLMLLVLALVMVSHQNSPLLCVSTLFGANQRAKGQRCKGMTAPQLQPGAPASRHQGKAAGVGQAALQPGAPASRQQGKAAGVGQAALQTESATEALPQQSGNGVVQAQAHVVEMEARWHLCAACWLRMWCLCFPRTSVVRTAGKR